MKQCVYVPVLFSHKEGQLPEFHVGTLKNLRLPESSGEQSDIFVLQDVVERWLGKRGGTLKKIWWQDKESAGSELWQLCEIEYQTDADANGHHWGKQNLL